MRLLYKNPPSLDVKESILLSDFNVSNRLTNQYPVNKIKLDKKARNSGPKFSAVNEWTEDTIPLLVINVPKITNRKVDDANKIFQDFNIPLFSCIIDE